jgi:arsenate reductase-like glutaredoxin family protein
MDAFSDKFDKTYSLEYGDPDLQCLKLDDKVVSNDLDLRSEQKNIKVDTKIYFKLDEKGIHGYITWSKFSKEVKKQGEDKELTTTKYEFKYPTIYINKNCQINPHEFYKFMREEVDKFNNNRIKLYNVKIISTKKESGGVSNHVVTMYDGKKRDLDKKEELYMSSFFHSEKDRLWELIKKIHFEPNFLRSLGQSPQVNLLFYGPPGTGKSSFAYRVAMCLDRHIISLDLRDIRKKSSMYQILNNPSVNGITKKPSECVFVFEEFDISIKLLYKEWHIRQNQIKKWENEIDTFDVESFINKKADDKEWKEKNDDNDKKKIQDELSALTPEAAALINQLVKVTEKDNSYGYSNHIPDLNLTEDKGRFSINDLLEIFQGTVPNDGAIIIATTNDYEEIREMCPALFRPGRLTPIYFGYADANILQEISNFYFKRDLEIPIPDKIDIPTSQIIQLAVECSTFDSLGNDEDKFDYFSSKLDEFL